MPPRKTANAVDAAALIASSGVATNTSNPSLAFVSTAKPRATRAPSASKKKTVLTAGVPATASRPSPADYAAGVSAFDDAYGSSEFGFAPHEGVGRGSGSGGGALGISSNSNSMARGSSSSNAGAAIAAAGNSMVRPLTSLSAPRAESLVGARIAKRDLKKEEDDDGYSTKEDDDENAEEAKKLSSAGGGRLLSSAPPSAVMSRASSMASIPRDQCVQPFSSSTLVSLQCSPSVNIANHEGARPSCGLGTEGGGLLGARAASVSNLTRSSTSLSLSNNNSFASGHGLSSAGATSGQNSNSLPSAAAPMTAAQHQGPFSASSVDNSNANTHTTQKVLSYVSSREGSRAGTPTALRDDNMPVQKAPAVAVTASVIDPQEKAVRDAILRCDDLADLSVLSAGGSLSSGTTTATSTSHVVRRALPASSAFAPASEITAALRTIASTGQRVSGLFNKNVDVGTGAPADPIKTPLYPHGGTNDSGCCHCTHTSHCDCEYVADVFYDVFENQLTQKRITERSSSAVPTSASSSMARGAAAASNSRSRSTTADAPGAAPSSASNSAASSTNTSFVSLEDDERSNSSVASGAGGYNAVPAPLSSKAVTSKAMATGSSTRHLCAKSLLPPFVARLIRLLDLQPGDSFYDFGCGNGSILFQAALSAGATCVGVELCPHNAQLARDSWGLIKPIFESKLKSAYPQQQPAVTGRGGRRNSSAQQQQPAPNVGIPHVEIITGDLCNILAEPSFYSRPRKILLSNLLFPKELTHYISKKCRALPKGSMIVCFDDLYPHGRSVCRVRDPEAFELFQMTDYEWPTSSVEWCYREGRFYIHTKRQ